MVSIVYTGEWLYYLQYSTELKQYMPDVLITLSLILLALNVLISSKTQQGEVRSPKWMVAGSVAIWASLCHLYLHFVWCGLVLPIPVQAAESTVLSYCTALYRSGLGSLQFRVLLHRHPKATGQFGLPAKIP